MNTSEAAVGAAPIQAQGPELPARRRAPAPLHGDHRRGRDIPDRGARLQDVPGDPGHLEGDPVDRPGRPASAQELQSQFSNSDKVVLWGIIGFGVVLVLSISAVGILITHKVAGPLYKIDEPVRAGPRQPARTGPGRLAQGRRAAGLLQGFREMHQAVRSRVEEDVRVLGAALWRRSRRRRTRGRPCSAALDELRQLRKRKEESLRGPARKPAGSRAPRAKLGQRATRGLDGGAPSA